MPRYLKQFKSNFRWSSVNVLCSVFFVKLQFRASYPAVIKTLNGREGQILQGIQDLGNR